MLPKLLFLTLSCSVLLFLFSCKNTKGTAQKLDINLLYATWNVASITTGGQGASGEAMGNPQYSFSQDGKRTKSYTSPPHSESTKYEIKGDSIFYPENPKLPAAKIVKLTKDSLILQSEKALWKLYK